MRSLLFFLWNWALFFGLLQLIEQAEGSNFMYGVGICVLLLTLIVNLVCSLNRKDAFSYYALSLHDFTLQLNRLAALAIYFGGRPDHVSTALWTMACLLVYAVLFGMPSFGPRDRVRYMSEWLEAGGVNADKETRLKIARGVGRARAAASLIVKLVEYRNKKKETLKAYTAEILRDFILNYGFTEAWAKKYERYNPHIFALLHSYDLSPEEAALMIIQDQEENGLLKLGRKQKKRPERKKKRPIPDNFGHKDHVKPLKTALRNRRKIDKGVLVAEPDQNELNIINDIIAHENDAFLWMQPRGVWLKNPAETLVQEMKSRGIIEDGTATDQPELKRIVTLGEDGEYHFTDFMSATDQAEYFATADEACRQLRRVRRA